MIILILTLTMSLVIVAQVFAPNTTACDQNIQFYYNNGCISRTCLSDKLSRIQLTIAFGQEKQTNYGVLGAGFTYQILAINGSAGTYFTVNIRYADNSSNQILSDPVGCINHHVYSSFNSYSVNSTRQGNVTLLTDGFTPLWPVPQYSYDPTLGAAISFNMSQAQMSQYCLTLIGPNIGGNIEYDCFFEVAFQVRGITQASYYFEAQVLLNNLTNVVAQTNFVQQVQVATCVPGKDIQCLINIPIASIFQFCDDQVCQNPTNTPAQTLFLNRVFFMKLAITDGAFKSFFIRSPQITMQSYGILQIVYPTSQLTFNSTAGSIIFNFSVPVVSSNVIISVTGTLSNIKNRFLQSTSSVYKNITTASVNSGPVSDSNSTSYNSSNSMIRSENGHMITVMLLYAYIFVL